MIATVPRTTEIYISAPPKMVTDTDMDMVEWSQRQAMASAKQFAPSNAKSMRKNTVPSKSAPAIEFDSFEYAKKMAMARLKREEANKGLNTITSPTKVEPDTKYRQDIDDGYVSSECETEASGRETPRANMRLLKELDAFEKTSSSKSAQRVETRSHHMLPPSNLEDIDEEEELQHLKEQQEMMAKEAEIRRKHEEKLEAQRREEQQLYMMRLEQLEIIRLQKALEKESGKGFAPVKRPTTAPAKRPARYFGEHNPLSDGAQLSAAAQPARPSTAQGRRGPAAAPSSLVTSSAEVASSTMDARVCARESSVRARAAAWNLLRRTNNAVAPDEDDKPFTFITPEPAPEPEPEPAAASRRNAWM